MLFFKLIANNKAIFIILEFKLYLNFKNYNNIKIKF